MFFKVNISIIFLFLTISFQVVIWLGFIAVRWSGTVATRDGTRTQINPLVETTQILPVVVIYWVPVRDGKNKDQYVLNLTALAYLPFLCNSSIDYYISKKSTSENVRSFDLCKESSECIIKAHTSKNDAKNLKFTKPPTPEIHHFPRTSKGKITVIGIKLLLSISWMSSWNTRVFVSYI